MWVNVARGKNGPGWLGLLACIFLLCCERKKPARKAPVKETPLVHIARAESLLGPMPVPADNPLTAEKIALGHQLFFEKRLSQSGTMSCYSCHQSSDGSGRHAATPLTDAGVPHLRHAPSLWNVGYLPQLMWDGSAPSLESTGPFGAHSVMGVAPEDAKKKASQIDAIPYYHAAFRAAFGHAASEETIHKALASYMRSLVCYNTRYDRYVAGDKGALTGRELHGLELFADRGDCTSCHSPPWFSDAYTSPNAAYHNSGIGTTGPRDQVDVGRMAVTGDAKDWAAFKTPSLRNVSSTAPYSHTGEVASLGQIVSTFAAGGIANPNLDARLSGRLSFDESLVVVAFLGTLRCERKLSPPPAQTVPK